MCWCRQPSIFGCLVPAETLLGRWRLTLDLFGRVFCDDIGAEPGSIISELGGFTVKETKFRREMEKLRNSQQRDLSLEVCILSRDLSIEVALPNSQLRDLSIEVCTPSREISLQRSALPAERSLYRGLHSQ